MALTFAALVVVAAHGEAATAGPSIVGVRAPAVPRLVTQACGIEPADVERTMLEVLKEGGVEALQASATDGARELRFQLIAAEGRDRAAVYLAVQFYESARLVRDPHAPAQALMWTNGFLSTVEMDDLCAHVQRKVRSLTAATVERLRAAKAPQAETQEREPPPE